MKIAIINSKVNNPNEYIVHNILQEFKNLLGSENIYYLEYNDLIKGISEFNIENLLILDGGKINNPIIQRAIQKTQNSFIWRFDDPYDMQTLQETIKWFDHIFTNDFETSKYGANITHLEIAAPNIKNDEIIPLQSRKIDILFVGTLWPNRTPYIKKLRSLKLDLNVVIIQNHLEFDKSHIFNIERFTSFFPRVSNLDYFELLKNTKIVLSLGRNFSIGNAKQGQADGFPPRLFEAMNAGCVQIIDPTIKSTQHNYKFKSILRIESEEQLEDNINNVINNMEKFNANASLDLNYINSSFNLTQQVKVIIETIRTHNSKKIKRSNDLPKVINVLHVNNNGLDEFENPLGGSDYWLKAILSNENKSIVNFVLSPTNDKLGYKIEYPDSCEFLQSNVYKTDWDLRDPILECALSEFVLKHKIEIVHINHLLNLPISILNVFRSLGLIVISTWHDFFGICSNFILFNGNSSGGYCGFLENKNVDHDLCLSKNSSIPHGSWLRRNKAFNQIMKLIDINIFPSQFAKDAYLNKIPVMKLANNIIINPPLPNLETTKIKYEDRVKTKQKTNLIKTIAFVGNISEHKGSNHLIGLSRILDFKKHKLILLGHTHIDLAQISGQIEGPFKYNPSDNSNFFKLINQIDLVVAISNWPETYQIIVDEITSFNIPIIVSELGDPAIRAEKNPLIYPVNHEITPEHLYLKIKSILNLDTKIGNSKYENSFQIDITELYKKLATQVMVPNIINYSNENLINPHLFEIFENQIHFPLRWN
jgi:hypothetical protein